MRWKGGAPARTSKIVAASAPARRRHWPGHDRARARRGLLRRRSVGRYARRTAFAAGGTGALPGIARRSAAAQVRLVRARGYRGRRGGPSSPPLAEPISPRRSCCSRAPSNRLADSRRPPSGRSTVPAIATFTSTCRSTRTCRAGSVRPATSRRRTSSRMKSDTTCRLCSAFPSATWLRASARGEGERARFVRSCKRTASPASGRTMQTARDRCSSRATSKKD